MSRLTWRNPEDGKIHLYGESADVVGKLANYEDLEEQCIEENQCGLGELLLKWKAFFDDIAELYDYRKAEEQGLLLRLPCKVGDTVWLLAENAVLDYEVRRIFITECGIEAVQIAKEIEGCEYWNAFYADSIGETVFFTKEEAEAALAEKGGA